MSRVLGRVELPKTATLLDLYLCSVILSVTSLHLQLVQVSTVLIDTWMWPETKFPECPGSLEQHKYSAHVKNITYSVLDAVFDAVLLSLSPACPINSVLVFNWMWPEIKVPESQDARATKNSAHVMNTSVSQENSVSQESSSSDQEMESAKSKFSTILQVKHNLCNPCSCLILKGPRWIGQSMMACTIHF